MNPRLKICGLTTREAVEAAAGADYLGFIFYAPSPRNISPKQAADLAQNINPAISAVAVTVDADDDFLRAMLVDFQPGYIQLHGSESPERVQTIREIFKMPVIKALQIRTQQDVEQAHTYEAVADMLLFDAKATEGLPGGNGLAFDWQMLAGKTFKKPWFLSGGLNIDNVEEALRISGALAVDVSSSLEAARGVKDPERVRGFIQKVKNLPL